MNVKVIILALMFVLLVPLYIAADNLVGQENREIKTSSVVLTISTTSEWGRVSLNGASIVDYKVVDKTEGLKAPIIDSTGIIINKHKNNDNPETVKLEIKLRVFDEKVELVTTKDYSGELRVNIGEVGEYKNNKKPLHLPLTVEITSDWMKVDFTGATIRNAKIVDISGATLMEPIIGTRSIILAKREVNDTSHASAKFLVDLSLDTPVPTIALEKADNGMAKMTIGGLVLGNNQTAVNIFKSIPLIIETTSHKTEINFQGLYIKRAKQIEIDKNNLSELIVGSDFIFINYSHPGDSYRKIGYLVDFGITGAPANITIMKDNPGYTIINLAAYRFADVGQDDNKSAYPIEPSNLPSITVKEPLFEIGKIKEDNYMERTLPLRIETTSDWTEVVLKDITISSAEIKNTADNIEKPVIGANNIFIKKPTSYDNSFASSEILLHLNLDETFIDQHKDAIAMMIAKGNIGVTTVQAGTSDSMVNAENIKNDPRNTKIYEIPLTAMQAEKKSREEILYNPVTYSVPLVNELYSQGIELVDTQEMRETYSIGVDELPGRNKIDVNLRKSEAVGLLSFVILSYLVLIVVGINILSKEGFFDFIPGLIGEEKTTVRTVSDFTIKLFEETPASSLFILEALVVLAITPFVLMASQIYAEGTAILAYFLLVFGVLLRLAGESEKANKIFQWQDFPVVMFLIKAASILMILSSLVVAGYELTGLYGTIVFFIPGLLFVFLVLRYLRKHFENGSYATEW